MGFFSTLSKKLSLNTLCHQRGMGKNYRVYVHSVKIAHFF